MKNLVFLIILVLSNQILHASPNVIYKIGMPFPSNHLFEIEIEVVDSSSENFTDFILPVWRTGRYVILNFASGVQNFSAMDPNGSSLKWNKIDKTTWRVQNNGLQNFSIKYKIFANEFGLRTRGLNDEKAFIDASTVLMYPEKLRSKPIELNIVPYDNWHITTGLTPDPLRANSFTSSDYDILADSPILIGNQKDIVFFIGEKKYKVSFSGEGNYNIDTVVDDYKKIITEITKFWKDVPFDDFTFMLMMNASEGGATEHLNSTIITVFPLAFSNKDSYRDFLSTSAHEFFHTWNVKQLRPKALVPYDFKEESYTGELWIAEGITSYYQNIFLLKSGLLSVDKYLEIISNDIRNDKERPGNYIQSLAEASFDAWIKANSNTGNKINSETNFYDKGANVGFLLDLEIRHSSDNKYSLDDVLRQMYKDFPLSKGGYTNDDFIKVSEIFAGKDLTKFFNSYLYGLDSLEWEKYLSFAGLRLNLSVDKRSSVIGATLRESADRLYVSNVTPGLPAYKAGLDINDEIIALNGFKVRRSNFENRISEINSSDTIRLTIFRDEKIKEINVIPEMFDRIKYTVERIEDPDEIQNEIYKSLFLNSK